MHFRNALDETVPASQRHCCFSHSRVFELCENGPRGCATSCSLRYLPTFLSIFCLSLSCFTDAPWAAAPLFRPLFSSRFLGFLSSVLLRVYLPRLDFSFLSQFVG
ncbi:unnamed protein product, partial [Ectocarpus sp. 12 AP-2014]